MEEGKKGEGLGREGRLPFIFPSFALFLSFLPPPPLFAPATQAKKIAICAPPGYHSRYYKVNGYRHSAQRFLESLREHKSYL